MTEPMTARPERPIHAPRGSALSCKGWPQEAALRMLMNNLDPDVAERWEDLVVYGGSGKAARSWDAYHRIVASLRSLEGDETLLVQSGKATTEVASASATRSTPAWWWSPTALRMQPVASSGCSPPIPAPASCATPMPATPRPSRRPSATASICPG